MPTFNNPSADAAEAQRALRGLAHATRSIDDPRDIYPVLGSLSSAAASLEQSLHQLAAFHDGPYRKRGGTAGGDQTGRASSHQVSWELHRASEILRQVAESLSHAHEAEATIAYDRRNFALLPDSPSTEPSSSAAPDPGLSL